MDMRTHEEGSTTGELETERRSVAEDAAYTGAEQGSPVRDAMRLHGACFLCIWRNPQMALILGGLGEGEMRRPRVYTRAEAGFRGRIGRRRARCAAVTNDLSRTTRGIG
jgi:hypothetical protein